jgi:hypothetical protein
MNRQTKASACLVLASALVAACAQLGGPHAEATSNRMSSPEVAARRAMEDLPRLITPANAAPMGFRSAEEAKAARLGRPIPRKIVGYDALLNYKAGTPLTQLFARSEELVYPLEVAGRIASSLTVTQVGDAWQVSSVADGYLGGLIAKALAIRPDARSLQIISMPGIGMDFAAFEDGKNWLLLPARDYGEVKLPEGRTVAADKALGAISDYTKDLDRRYGDQIRKRKLLR